MSAVYREKVRLCLQCNYKQLKLNFITINELNLVFFMDTEFPRGRGGSSKKNCGNSRQWGVYCEVPWNGKSWGVGGQTGKNPLWRVWIFSGTTQWRKVRIVQNAFRIKTDKCKLPSRPKYFVTASKFTHPS